jgi:hypothetical protein
MRVAEVLDALNAVEGAVLQEHSSAELLTYEEYLHTVMGTGQAGTGQGATHHATGSDTPDDLAPEPEPELEKETAAAEGPPSEPGEVPVTGAGTLAVGKEQPGGGATAGEPVAVVPQVTLVADAGAESARPKGWVETPALPNAGATSGALPPPA